MLTSLFFQKRCPVVRVLLSKSSTAKIPMTCMKRRTTHFRRFKKSATASILINCGVLENLLMELLSVAKIALFPWGNFLTNSRKRSFSELLIPKELLPHRTIAPLCVSLFFKEKPSPFSLLALLQHAKIAHAFRTRRSSGVGLLYLNFLASEVPGVKTCFSCAATQRYFQ